MLLILISLLQFIAIKGSYFETLVNSDASSSVLQYTLISKVKTNSKLICLSECSKKSDCLTAVYQMINLSCFLYEDQLGSSDIVSSTTSNLYLKKSSKLRII